MVIQLNHFNGDFPILSNRFLKVIVKYIRIAFHSFLNIIRKYLQLVNLFITLFHLNYTFTTSSSE